MAQAVTPPRFSIANPAFIYAASWLTILALFQWHLTIILQPMSAAALTLVLSSVAAAVGMGLIVYLLLPAPPRLDPERLADGLQLLYRWRQWALIAWALGTFVEIVQARGLPVVWLLLGDHTKDYRNFGIFSVHGFLMALFFFSSAATAVEVFLHGRWKRAWWLLAMLGWQLLLINRGGLMWQVLQTLGVFLICRPIRLRQGLASLAAALVFILVFGIVGDARGGAMVWMQDLVQPNQRWLVSLLPSGFLWVYIYATTPLNNVVGGLGTFEPVGFFFFSVQALLPTVLRDLVFNRPDLKFPLGLVNPAFNTSTWFVGWLADFGVPGAVAGTSVLLLISILFFRSARAWRPWAIVGYAACFQGVVLSAFADTFTSLVTLFQLFLAAMLGLASFWTARQRRLAELTEK